MTDIAIVLKDLGVKGNIQGFYHLRLENRYEKAFIKACEVYR